MERPQTPYSVLVWKDLKLKFKKYLQPMEIRIIAMVLRQLCRALDCLHSANIIHRFDKFFDTEKICSFVD